MLKVTRLWGRRRSSGEVTLRLRQLSQATTPFSHKQELQELHRLDFASTETAYRTLSTGDLIKGIVVLRLAGVRPVVNNAGTLLKASHAVLGSTITNSLIRSTFFSHFCAGETAEDVAAKAHLLQQHGVGGILDYVAEADAGEEGVGSLREGQPVAREYDYAGEALCDVHEETFRQCIRSVAGACPGGFSAVKLTALGNPKLLVKLSTCVNELKKLFQRMDDKQKGSMSLPEFRRAYASIFRLESPEDEASFKQLTSELELWDASSRIDYIEWSNRISMTSLQRIVRKCRTKGPLSNAVLTTEEAQLFNRMLERARGLSRLAKECGVRLMVDAENSSVQGGVDHLAYQMQREFNTGGRPTVFTTCQCYLRSSPQQIEQDMVRAQRFGQSFACKLVRGAYLDYENKQAEKLGVPSPVWSSAEETHQAYDEAIDKVLEYKAGGNAAEVMVATHNQRSVERTVQRMQQLQIPHDGGVFFGQLLGMGDHLTFSLGDAGYQPYKYLPFGPVRESIPYLLRRAQENSSMLAGSSHDRRLMASELYRRAAAAALGRP